MKRNFLFVTALIAMLLLLSSCTPRRAPGIGNSEEGLPLLRERVSLRDFTLPTASGEAITLSELKDDVVFLYFWTTW